MTAPKTTRAKLAAVPGDTPAKRPGRVKGQTVEPIVIDPGLAFTVEAALPSKGNGPKLEKAVTDALTESEKVGALSAPVAQLGGTWERAESVLRRHAAALGKGVAIREHETQGRTRIVFRLQPKRQRKAKEE